MKEIGIGSNRTNILLDLSTILTFILLKSQSFKFTINKILRGLIFVCSDITQIPSVWAQLLNFITIIIDNAFIINQILFQKPYTIHITSLITCNNPHLQLNKYRYGEINLLEIILIPSRKVGLNCRQCVPSTMYNFQKFLARYSGTYL